MSGLEIVVLVQVVVLVIMGTALQSAFSRIDGVDAKRKHNHEWVAENLGAARHGFERQREQIRAICDYLNIDLQKMDKWVALEKEEQE